MKRRRRISLGLVFAALAVLVVVAACGAKDENPTQPRSAAAVDILAGDRYCLRYTSQWIFSDQRPVEFVEVKDGSLRLQKYDGDDGDPIVTITENRISKVFIGGEPPREIPLPEAEGEASVQMRYNGKTGAVTLEEASLSYEEYDCGYNGTDFTLQFLFLGEDLWGIQYDEGRYIRVLELREDIPPEYEALYKPR